jgi:prephenate dehydratase
MTQIVNMTNLNNNSSNHADINDNIAGTINNNCGGDNKITIAFQGENGAYSEEALINYCELNSIDFGTRHVKSFRDLFNEIILGCGFGMVPIENSNAGSVVENYDLFTEFADNIEIVGEFKLAVNHNLLTKSGTKLSDIKKVYSHPQALSQCSIFLEANGIEAVSFEDTAGAAKFVSESDDSGIGSLSSSLCSSIYGLDILGDCVKNADDNTTRFFLVKRRGLEFNYKLPESNKSTVFFITRDFAGALYKCLGAFATNGFNLAKIESRPSKLKKFDYVFFIDVESDLVSSVADKCLEELSFFAKDVRIGRYYSKK